MTRLEEEGLSKTVPKDKRKFKNDEDAAEEHTKHSVHLNTTGDEEDGMQFLASLVEKRIQEGEAKKSIEADKMTAMKSAPPRGKTFHDINEGREPEPPPVGRYYPKYVT
jgi:hypothetical protein